ncbi:hypothetical protein ACF1BS_04160 [Streptomyces sp. NPDC014748]|uniref:hypothetical protein n=1 Tax=Streptomyces sp. NPDC014748 TaxID=3364905 RepID=UPI0036FA6F1A
MRVIVAAAGPQTKWGGYLGVRSHFAPVRAFPDEETPVLPLLELTLTQVAFHSGDVWVTAPAEAPGPYTAAARAHGARAHVADPVPAGGEFESSRPVWAAAGRTVLLLGDVYFTGEALAAILKDDRAGIRVFGRRGPSAVTGTPWGEIFAVSWTDNARMGELTDAVRRAQQRGHADVPAGWLALRLLQGTPLREHTVRAPWWAEIDDGTDDIDFPADYRRHPARGIR